MEVFQHSNKVLLGKKRMISRVRESGMMADEVLSDKNRMAEEGSLTKVLFYNVIWQTQKSGAICSVDTDNCCDQVAHTIVSLIF